MYRRLSTENRSLVVNDRSITRNPVPDPENRLLRYDFSQEDGTTPVYDRSGNGLNLTGGFYSGVGVIINGIQAGGFDGVGDRVFEDLFGGSLDLPAPFSLFVVMDGPEQDGISIQISDTSTGGGDALFDSNHAGSPQTVDTTNDIAGGDLNETPSVFCLVAEEPNGHVFIRQDTQEVAAGNARILEEGNMDDFGIGGRMTDEQFAQFNYGKIPLYAGNGSQRNMSVENYLIHRWNLGV
jgi:hypothetical protein